MGSGRVRSISLDGACRLAERAVQQLSLPRSTASALPELEPVELPSSGAGLDEAAVLRRATPLYLACELHNAGFLDALETVARLYAAGGVPVDLGPIGDALGAMWRSRHQTLSPEERVVFCRQVNGWDEQGSLDTGLLDLSSAVLEAAERAEPRAQRTVRRAVDALGAIAADRVRGIPDVVIEELLGAVRRSVEVFGDHEVQRWLGVRSTLGAVQTMFDRSLVVGGRRPKVVPHLERAKAGAVLLGWAGDLLAGDVPGDLKLPPAVVDAALEWVDATSVVFDMTAA